MGTHRRQLWLVAVACGALVWVGVAASSAGDPKKRLTAAGNAYARSYLLHETDLPAGEWRSRRANFDAPNPSCVVKHYSLGALTLDGEAGDIYEFGTGLPLVESDAHVFVSAAQARRAFSIESRSGFARCLGAGLGGPGVRVRALQLGGLGAIARGFRIDIPVRSERLVADLVMLRHGRAIGALSVINRGSPWPERVVRSLVATMARRMAR